MKPFRFIGYPHDAGVDTAGSARAPSKLLKNHRDALEDLLRIDASQPPRPLEIHDAAVATKRACERLQRSVDEALSKQELPLVIGGDHTCAMGTWPVVHERQSGGLLYVDAHMDAHTPETSQSKNLHGMTLSQLLTDRNWLGMGAETASLSPDRVCLFGIRSFEDEERSLLDELGVTVITDEHIANEGLQASFGRALERVSGRGGFGCSLDLDVFSPEQIPGVNTRTDGGVFEPGAFFDALRSQRSNLTGLEIAEYNPDRDRRDQTATAIVQGLRTLIAL